MTVNQAIRYQWKQLKDKPLKTKIIHVLSYFWIPIVTVIVLAVLLISQVSQITSQKKTVLSVACINALTSDKLVQDYCLRMGSLLQIDPDNQEICIDTSFVIAEENLTETYQCVQKFAAMVNAHEIDLVVGNFEHIRSFAYSEYFCNLADYLSTEQMAKYRDHLLYMDGALLQDINPVAEPIVYPDAQMPENMTDPIPVALLVPMSSYLSDTFYLHHKGDVVVSVVVGAEKNDNIIIFLETIMEEKGGL